MVDEYIPEPKRETDKPFMMRVEDVFSIKGRGTVVTGRVDRGIIKMGEPIEIIGLRETKSSVVTGVEMFHKQLDEGMAGDNVGLLLRGIEREDVERGSGVGQAEVDHAAQEVSGAGVRVEEGRGRTAQGVLQRLSAAVLHPDDGCDGRHHAAGRCGDGDAWRQCEPDGGVDRAGGARAGLQVRHS